MKTAEQVCTHDLDYICQQGQEEFSRMSGRAVMIAGGAGFLGYYLVQAVLHWNRQNPSRQAIRVTVLDNLIRGVPDWLTALKGNPHLRLIKHDITVPLPAELGDMELLVHAASIASPIYYRKYPIETMDANVNGLRYLLDYC